MTLLLSRLHAKSDPRRRRVRRSRAFPFDSSRVNCVLRKEISSTCRAMMPSQFAVPPQYVQPVPCGTLPVVNYQLDISRCNGAGWSSLQQAQLAVASPVCVMDAEAQALGGAPWLQSPPTVSSAPCGGLISMPLGVVATAVAAPAPSKAPSKRARAKQATAAAAPKPPAPKAPQKASVSKPKPTIAKNARKK